MDEEDWRKRVAELEKERDALAMQVETLKGESSRRANKPGNPPRDGKRKDIGVVRERHIALKIAYLGWDSHGFASQANAENTIEAHLFEALHQCYLVRDRASSHYSRCGRTDKGVSALCQIVALRVRSRYPHGRGVIPVVPNVASSDINDGLSSPSSSSSSSSGFPPKDGKSSLMSSLTEEERDQSYPRDFQSEIRSLDNIYQHELPYDLMLNRILPEHIRVLSWHPVEINFNARFRCLHRTYKYYFVGEHVDVELMKQAAQKLIGEHDFSFFCRADHTKDVINFTRRIISFDIQLRPHTKCLYEVTIQGYAFLWHQVRCMMGILFLIGAKKEDVSVIDTLLAPPTESNVTKRPTYELASELPLCLDECGFEDVTFRLQRRETSDLNIRHFEYLYRQHLVKASIIQRCLDKLRQTPLLHHGAVLSPFAENHDHSNHHARSPCIVDKKMDLYISKMHVPFHRRLLPSKKRRKMND